MFREVLVAFWQRGEQSRSLQPMWKSDVAYMLEEFIMAWLFNVKDFTDIGEGKSYLWFIIKHHISVSHFHQHENIIRYKKIIISMNKLKKCVLDNTQACLN